MALSMPWAVGPGADALRVSQSDSTATLVGRIAGDLASIIVGVESMVAGVGATGSGGAICVTGVGCVAGAPAAAVGVAVAATGAVVAGRAAANLGGNLSQISNDKQTDHFGDQKQDPSRPTKNAWSDAQKAGSSSVYRDAETGNYIVKGKDGRVHVFKMENGQLKAHTSFYNTASNTQQRLMNGRWEYLTQEEYYEWLNYLQSTLGGD
jgi:hypothetical protein